MLEILLTTIMKLHAAFRMRSCLHFLTTALLLFQILSWGALFVHNQESVHAIGANGIVVHIEHPDVQMTDIANLHAEDIDDHDDSCPAMEHALRASTPVPVFNAHSFEFCKDVTISHEIIAKRLEIVYLSHLALSRAPKQSPPVA